MKNNCILITGGCGFIGLNFLDFMLKKGFNHFRILDNLSVGQIEDLESLLSEYGNFDKVQEGNRITYNLPQSSVLSLPCEIHGNEEQSEFHQGPDSSLRSVELLVGDIRNPHDCLMSTKNVSAVIHLAAQAGVPTSVEDPVMDCEVNILGTLNMLEACRKNNVDKFIFASSSAPLGEVEPPIHEEKVPHPVSPYGASKLAGEAYCNAYYKTFGINTVVLRFSNVYGPRSNHKTSVVANFFKRALEGLPLEIYGDGTQTRDFIYVEDLSNAIFLCLNALSLSPQFYPVKSESHLTGASVLSPNNVSGQTFQIATFKETTVNEIALNIKTLVENENGRKVEIFYRGKRLGDVERNYSDIRKAMKLLKFTPNYDLHTGLSAVYQHIKQNGETDKSESSDFAL